MYNGFFCFHRPSDHTANGALEHMMKEHFSREKQNILYTNFNSKDLEATES